jgi:DNA helicase IV
MLHLDEVAMALTNDQYKVLDWAIDNPRIICTGGAGTGKTLVALEVARRRRDEGSSVIFTCGSRPLLDFLERQPRVSGINFVEWSHLTSLSKVDFLVVDEAQDFLGPEFELVVSSILRSGLTNGEWFISLDPNRQSGLVKPFDKEFYEILRSYSTVMRLNRNVRNTLTIIEQTRWATNADLGVDGTGTGPEVNWVASTNGSTEGDLVAREVRRLIDEESLHPSEIAILCVNPSAKPSFSESALRELGVPLLNLGSASHRSGVVFASVSDFKGMERQAILIVGARNLDQIANPLNHLYTGMSRARGFLWIATTPELGDLIQKSRE